MRRKLALSYAEMETRGVFLPVVEAHLDFQGGARYDDRLKVASRVAFSGRARLRFEVQITHPETERRIVSGYTIHAFTDRQARPVRPPPWFVRMFESASRSETSTTQSQ